MSNREELHQLVRDLQDTLRGVSDYLRFEIGDTSARYWIQNCDEAHRALSQFELSLGEPLTAAEINTMVAQYDHTIHGPFAEYIVRITEIVHGIGKEKK